MRIAIDFTYRLHGGGLTHLTSLLAAWSRMGVTREHEIILFVRPEHVAVLEEWKSELQLVEMPLKETNSIFRVLWQQLWLPKAVKAHGAEVLFCPGGIAPIRPGLPTVTAFRNAAPFCDGINPKTVGWRGWLHYKTLGVLMRLAAKKSTRVIFLSNYFKKVIVQQFGFDPVRGDVIYHGRDGLNYSEDPDLVASLGVTRKMLLCVSHLYRYKNMPALVEGYAKVRTSMQSQNWQLVLVGKAVDDNLREELIKQIRQLGLEEWILLPGALPHDKIGSLMKVSEAFVFQTTCENCPNTLIEALVAGLPIATANIGVMPEIAGDSAVYYDPFRPDEIATALNRLATESELRERLRKTSVERGRTFPSWDEVGTLTLQSLLRAAGK